MFASQIVETVVPLAVAVTLGGGWWWNRGRKAGRAQQLAQVEVMPAMEVPSRIVVGMSADQPAFEIALTADEAEFDRAAPAPDNERLGLVSRMSACLQAVPSLLVQQAHQGRHLMEVVINNPLANAASGSHFLPFARGADGKIIEQAKLLNPQGLSSLVNAAAIWQVASVVVAQKHLADISAKLDEIKGEIVDLKHMLHDQMDGGVEGTYDYLRGVAMTFQLGEVPKFARVELESCRRELRQTVRTLMKMFTRRMAWAVEHKETVGTGDLLTDTMKRYDELDRITASIGTCFKTEALAWHVLSLFPGEEATAQVWKTETLASIGAFTQLQAGIQETANADASRFQSWFNFESTLQERREAVLARADNASGKIERSATQCQFGMNQTTLQLEHNNDPIRLGLEIVNGSIQQVRVLA